MGTDTITDRQQPSRSWALWGWLALAALPALLPLAQILTYGVDSPYFDEWDPDIAGVYIKAHQGTLRVADLNAQHNEHRVLVPRVLLLVVNSITRWRTVSNMVLGWMIVCAASAIVLWLIARTRGPAEGAARLDARVIGGWFVCNLLIFSPTAVANWVFGFGCVANALPVAFSLAAVAVVHSEMSAWKRTAVGIICAGLATYSTGVGALAWPMAMLVVAWPVPGEPFEWRARHLIAWAAAATLLLALYFVDYQRAEHGGVKFYATSFSAAITHFLVFLGMPFMWASPYPPEGFAAVAGAIMMAMFAAALGYLIFVWRVHRDPSICQRMLVWISVAMFALGCGVLAAVARAGAGTQQLLTASRYVTFAILLPVALVQLVPMICDDLPTRLPRFGSALSRLPATLLSALLLLQAFCYPFAMEASKGSRLARLEGKGALLMVNLLAENRVLARQVSGNFEKTREQARVLNEMGYLRPKLIQSRNASKIQETSASAVAGALGRIEQAGPQPSGQLAVTGWAAFTAKSAPADFVFLTYDNEQSEPIVCAFAEIGMLRDDVVKELKSSDYLHCGWVAELPAGGIPSEIRKTTLRAWAMDTDTGKAFLLDGSLPIGR